MGFFSSLFGSGTACSKCGAKKKPLNQGGGGAKVLMGTPEQMLQMVFKCYGCSRFVCGDCSAVPMGGATMFKCPFCRNDMGPCDA